MNIQNNDTNPFLTGNITQQVLIFKSDPAKAHKLQAAANESKSGENQPVADNLTARCRIAKGETPTAADLSRRSADLGAQTPVKLPSYTQSEVPPANKSTYQLAVITDEEGDDPMLAWSDGTAWRSVQFLGSALPPSSV